VSKPRPHDADPAILPGGRTLLRWPSLLEQQRFEQFVELALAEFGEDLRDEYTEAPRHIRERALLCWVNDLLAQIEEPARRVRGGMA